MEIHSYKWRIFELNFGGINSRNQQVRSDILFIFYPCSTRVY